MKNESDIIRRLQNGNEKALSELMKLHQDYVFTVAYRFVKNREKAEEITQDVFIKVYRKIDTYQFHSKFTTWLYTIVYRTSLNLLGKKNILINETDQYGEEDSSVTYFERLLNKFDSSLINTEFDTNKILWKAIDRLSIMQGLCITLFYLNQFSIDEICEILKLPANTVKTNLHRGRKKLKTILLRQYSKEEIL